MLELILNLILSKGPICVEQDLPAEKVCIKWASDTTCMWKYHQLSTLQMELQAYLRNIRGTQITSKIVLLSSLKTELNRMRMSRNQMKECLQKHNYARPKAHQNSAAYLQNDGLV